MVDFYNRGGDGRGSEAQNSTGLGVNATNRAPVIGALGLTPADKANLVAFLKALTDERVRMEQAPFDHPELKVPNGHPGDELRTVGNPATSQAQDDYMVIPAVGAAGRAAKKLPPLMPFESGLK